MIATKSKTTRKRQRVRRKSEFARCYHSRSRVQFVKVMGCSTCGWESGEPIENAHTGTRSGAGRKAGYETIVPFCRSCHREYDAGRYQFCKARNFAFVKRAAAVESAWQDWGE